MNGALARRLAAVGARLVPPPAAFDGAGDRLAAQLAQYAERIHADGRPLADDAREAPAMRCVVAAMQDADGVGAWGSPEYGRRFWKGCLRYLLGVKSVQHHPAVLGDRGDWFPAMVAQLRAWPAAGPPDPDGTPRA